MIELRAASYEEAEPLIRALWDEIVERYGGDDGDGVHDAHGQQFLPPDGVFLIAVEEGQHLACGGVRRHEAHIGEIKRMYVVPQARGRGLGRQLLQELVARARSLGYTELWLETGTEQPEAMALYASEGFTPIPPYGTYKDEPDSRCYRLELGSQ